MLVPTDWDTIVRGRSGPSEGIRSDESHKRKDTPVGNAGTQLTKKRKKTVSRTSEQPIQSAASTSDTGTVRSIADVCHNILCAINKSQPVAVQNDALAPNLQELNLDCVLSRVPYRQLLEDLFGGNRDLMAPTIPLVSRGYEVKKCARNSHSWSIVQCVMPNIGLTQTQLLVD